MASQIRISPDQMRERANSYQTESGNVSEMIGRLDSLLQSLLGEWEGSASEAYRERYESLRPVSYTHLDVYKRQYYTNGDQRFPDRDGIEVTEKYGKTESDCGGYR